jgi:hypothetical protein
MKVLKHLRCLKLWLKIFHVGLEPQPLHNGNGITCSPGVTTLFFASNPQIWANHNCGNGRMNPAAHTQHINVLKHIICVKSKLETFHAGVDPQPLHNGITCSPGATPGFLPNSQIWANNKCGNGIMFAPAAHTQHMNVLKHLDVWSKGWKHSNSTMASLVAQV